MTPDQILKLSGQELSDECARMMSWFSEEFHGEDCWVSKEDKVKIKSSWKPHTSYDQCRIVEDWMWDHDDVDIWNSFAAILWDDTLNGRVVMRSTCEQRLRAALLAFNERK